MYIYIITIIIIITVIIIVIYITHVTPSFSYASRRQSGTGSPSIAEGIIVQGIGAIGFLHQGLIIKHQFDNLMINGV